MNLKNEFSKWFSPKAPDSYKNWFKKNLDEKLNDINDAYMASFGRSLFDIDTNNISKEILGIRNNIMDRNNAENKTFVEYDKKNASGIPKAIINKYYIRFLEIFSEGNGDTEASSADDKTITSFTYEKDLQNSLISQAEELFQGYKIFGENGEGIEYNINGKRIDILLEHKTENKLLVVELKAGKADYKTFGQIAMYIGPLLQKYPDKQISGVIIAGEIDESLKMSISAYNNVKTMTYEMKLKLDEVR
jgi:predicted nuclease of restriction endonuclease-like (RecB) superfamily